MFKEFDETLSFETNILEAGAYFRLSTSNPEALPIHLTTAHNVEDLEDLQKKDMMKKDFAIIVIVIQTEQLLLN